MRPATLTEYRIRSRTEAGYWTGKKDGFTTEDAAREALAEYTATVRRDTFVSYETRERHIASLVLEARTVTTWRDINTPPEAETPENPASPI